MSADSLANKILFIYHTHNTSYTWLGCTTMKTIKGTSCNQEREEEICMLYPKYKKGQHNTASAKDRGKLYLR